MHQVNYCNELCVTCGALVYKGTGVYSHKPRARVYCKPCYKLFLVRTLRKSRYKKAKVTLVRNQGKLFD